MKPNQIVSHVSPEAMQNTAYRKPIYKVISLNNEFAAFWQEDEERISFFVPSDLMCEKCFIQSLDKWHKASTYYTEKEKDDLQLYNEIINSAWYFLAQKNIYIDKSKVTISDIEPGIYYPRIWRGHLAGDNPLASYNAVNPRREYGHRHLQSATAVSSLFDYLSEIFRYTEPSKGNLPAFGHKIRELLILACTEIESGWRAIIEENTHATNPKKSYTTSDYFKVKEPLHLDEWCVALKDYPNLDSFMPFKQWNGSEPTKSLSWYDAYNAVKHHREVEFSKATLDNLLNAMAGLYIMQIAQWGPEIYSLLQDNRFSPFEIVQYPAFDASELYMPSIDGNESLTPGLYFG